MARRSSSDLGAANIFGFATSVIMLALITFGVLYWLNIPVGSFLDWLIGIGAFAWLMTIVTVPWNIHFEAREVLNEADVSRKKEMTVDERQISYVRRIYRWSLIGALALHLISTGFFYWIAQADISPVGYYSAGAALLLTLLRPAIRAYEYISTRLASIREEITYPREDAWQLKLELQRLDESLKTIQNLLDPKEENSWLSQQETKMDQIKAFVKMLKENFDQFREANEKDHERIQKETRHAVAQLSEDGKFIDNLVEIIRFIKKV